jgi:endoglucanase
MTESGTAVGRVRRRTLSASLAAAVALSLCVAPGSAAVASTPSPVVVEGERFNPPSTARVVTLGSASGGAALRFSAPGRATASVQTPGVHGLWVRARTDSCGKATARVTVNGVPLGTIELTGTRWTSFVFDRHFAPGRQSVVVEYLTSDRSSVCGRLYLDRVEFGGPGSTGWQQPNPLAGARFWVNPHSQVARSASTFTGRDREALVFLAGQPNAVWFGDWTPTATLSARVAKVVSDANAVGQVPVLVVYNIPLRDCGGPSGGGAPDSVAYRAWVDAFVAGLAGGRSVVIIEPDATAHLSCVPAARRTERLALLRYATGRLGRTAGVTAYLDGGSARWVPPRLMAPRLRDAGVQSVRGFSVNVARFNTTRDELAYAEVVSSLLGGANYVVDTSRNGLGPVSAATDPLHWCNPPGRALGPLPRSDRLAGAHADAYLWVKTLGLSDGDCRPGEPKAGTWWPEYAIGLVHRMWDLHP